MASEGTSKPPPFCSEGQLLMKMNCITIANQSLYHCCCCYGGWCHNCATHRWLTHPVQSLDSQTGLWSGLPFPWIETNLAVQESIAMQILWTGHRDPQSWHCLAPSPSYLVPRQVSFPLWTADSSLITEETLKSTSKALTGLWSENYYHDYSYWPHLSGEWHREGEEDHIQKYKHCQLYN